MYVCTCMYVRIIVCKYVYINICAIARCLSLITGFEKVRYMPYPNCIESLLSKLKRFYKKISGKNAHPCFSRAVIGGRLSTVVQAT